jgi:glycosyltransferase involved in cell wall biosynthesis
MNIVVVTLTYNEESIIGFFLRHYHFASKIIIYDSGSTDRTLEIARKNPKVEIRDRAPTHGVIDDGENMRLKNEAWKDTGADWVVVVDCDEFLWHPSIPKLLQKCDRHGWTIVGSEAYEMVGTAIPESGMLTDWIKTGVRSPQDRHMDKTIIFKPVAALVHGPGCHDFVSAPNQRTCPEKVKLLHYKWLSRKYVMDKANACKLSEENKKHGWGMDGDGRPSSERWSWSYRNYLETAKELDFLAPMKINFVITAHARQEYLLPLCKILQGYTKIRWNSVVVMSDMREDQRLTSVKQIVVENAPAGNNGHSFADFSKTQTGYNHLHNQNPSDFRFVKIGIDSWLTNQDFIIQTFNDLEYRQAGYAGNRWKEDEPSLSTDIFFADTRFGNVFKDFHCEVPNVPDACFEWWMDWHCKRKGVRTKIIPERVPVHPHFRFECEAIGLTAHHTLETNLANASRWGAL